MKRKTEKENRNVRTKKKLICRGKKCVAVKQILAYPARIAKPPRAFLWRCLRRRLLHGINGGILPHYGTVKRGSL